MQLATWKNVLGAGLLAAAMLGTTAEAQKTDTVYAGATHVKLSSAFVSALTALDVKAGTVRPTAIADGIATFPISGGAIDLDTGAGNILHTGGLTLEGGSMKVRLQSFIIDTTGAQPKITGLVIVNNKLVGRLPLFDLTLPPGFMLPLKTWGNTLQVKGVAVTLDAAAAGALNNVFSVSAFTPGFNIGTATVTAYVSSSDWTY